MYFGRYGHILIIDTWWHEMVAALGNLGETRLSNLCLRPYGKKRKTWGKSHLNLWGHPTTSCHDIKTIGLGRYN